MHAFKNQQTNERKIKGVRWREEKGMTGFIQRFWPQKSKIKALLGSGYNRLLLQPTEQTKQEVTAKVQKCLELLLQQVIKAGIFLSFHSI